MLFSWPVPVILPKLIVLHLQLSPQGSGNGDHRLTNGSLTAGSSMSSPSTVSLPQRIHQITLNYVSHVYSLVQCHDLWEQADGQANEFTGVYTTKTSHKVL